MRENPNPIQRSEVRKEVREPPRVLSGSVAEIPQTILHEIIELEADNMIPILKAAGIEVSERAEKGSEAAWRESDLCKDPTQRLIVVLRGERLSAFLRYSREPTHVFIKSMQLKDPKSSAISLRELLKHASHEMEGLPPIESVVQKSNFRSMKLHQKLGFEVLKEMPKATRFRIQSAELRERIHGILRTHRD